MKWHQERDKDELTAIDLMNCSRDELGKERNEVIEMGINDDYNLPGKKWQPSTQDHRCMEETIWEHVSMPMTFLQ
jgi:hypothetical protein